jgi:3-deoxy-D-manno-octulosonic-acid transferase
MYEQVEKGLLDADFSKIENFLNGQKAIVIGSSWPAEEKLIMPFILRNPNLKFIIAPHDISEGHINFIINKLGNQCIRFTNLNEELLSENCLILDTIGHLSKAYYFGEIAIIGGGFTGKLHNILEPASFGLPVLFGPKHNKFPEADLFVNKGLAFEFHSASDLEDIIPNVILQIKTIKPKVDATVNSFLGVSQQIIKLST